MPPSAETQQRTPPEEALPSPEIGATAVAGSAAGGVALGAAVGTAAGVTALAPAVALLKLGTESLEKILEGLRVFFVVARARQEKFIVRMSLRTRRPVPRSAIYDLIAREGFYQAEFERKVKERLTRKLRLAFQLPEKEQLPRLRKVLALEQVYARQRAEAMAVRSLGALDVEVLKLDYPQGAQWILGPAKQHTSGCRLLGGRVLPWVALDVLSPPAFHHGCGCRLGAPPAGMRVMSVRSAMWLIQRAREAEAAHEH